MTEEEQKIDFPMFLVMWNQQQNMKTPALHVRIARWLEGQWRAENKRLLLMAFRSAGKSSLVGVFAAWLLYCNPNIRILVLAADGALAGKMVRNVRRIIERHPATVHLKPQAADQWASERFTVARDLELRDPSMLARGVGANITGSRADIVICDDVEVPNSCDSAEKRENLRERLAEMNYVLAAGGAQLYVGTPHHYYSIYSDVAREDIGEEKPFLDGFERLCVPILDEDGRSVWPERYNEEDIAAIRRAAGPNKFDSQMMLKAVNILEGRLDPELLRFYNSEIEYVRETRELYLGQHKMVAAACWWDPAFAAAKGDDSVVAVVFNDMGGNYYLHHLEYMRVAAHSREPEAQQQAKMVTQIVKKFRLPYVCVEINGLGRFLPSTLRQALDEAGVECSVLEKTAKDAKATRILEGFDAVMASQRLYVHENIRNTPFLMEMREWQPTKKSARDDGLDAVAGAILHLPEQIIHGKKRRGGQDWMRSRKTYTAKGQYEV